MAGLTPPPALCFIQSPAATYERSAMSNVFTLDALREETVKKFEPVTVKLSDDSTVELRAVLRLGKNEREAVAAAIDEISKIDDDIDDDDEDAVDEYAEKIIDSIEKVFKLIATKPKKLLAELDHEDPQIKVSLYTALLQKWIGETQVGEAGSSPA